MRQTLTLAKFLDMSECEADGLATYGPLAFKSPDEIYWGGRKMGATPTQAKILGMLIRFRKVDTTVLLMVLPSEESGVKTVQAHICRLRELLRFATNEQVKINTDWGQGYHLVVEE